MDMNLTRKSDPRYDEDLINKKYLDKNLNEAKSDFDSQFNNMMQTFETKIQQLGLTLYPVGSIYISTVNTNPKYIIGGEWDPIKDTFLLCAGNTYKAGSSGGSADHLHSTAGHKLTVDEMPKHTHTQNPHSHLQYKTWPMNSGTGTLNYLGGTKDDGFSGSSNYVQETTATNNNTGGDGTHDHGNTGRSSNLPPYLAVYVWKRTK